MKSAYLLLLFLIIGGTGFYFYRGQYLQYPVRMEIVNAKGETINAVINGRNQREVFFTIDDIEQEYQYPISKLDVWSRIKLYLHPKELPPRQDQGGSTTGRESRRDPPGIDG